MIACEELPDWPDGKPCGLELGHVGRHDWRVPAVDPDDAFEVGSRPLAQDAFDKPRRFLLHRHADAAGITAVGAVAWGCLWPSGRVSLDWQIEHQMRGGYYESIEDVIALHGTATSVEWLDV